MATLGSLQGKAPLPELLGSMLEGAPFGVYVDHPVQGCVYANQVLLDWFRLPWDEFRGFGWARAVYPEDAERIEGAITRFQHTLEPLSMAYRILDAAGNLIWLRAEAQALRNPAGEHVGTLALVTDVTAERENAARLARSQKLEAVGKLAGRVAHDFNNLLSAIYASASVIGPEVQSDLAKECLDTIEEAVESAQQVTNYLLALTRNKVRGGPCCPDSELSEIDTVLRRTLGETVRLEVLPNCPGAWVSLDPTHFKQIVIDLAINARDAMPEGGTLAIVTRRDGERLVVELQDSGEGVAPEDLERVFEPFFTTRAADLSTGLGLSTVRDLVQLAGGRVALESQPGQGTLVRISLPVLDVLPEARSPQPLPRSASGARVLLIDDHDALRQSLSYALGMYGYRVVAAPCLREARERLAEDVPDAVVVDVLLPDGNGVEFLREVRAQHSELPVVLISGFVGEAGDDLEEGLDPRHTAFLPKPVRPRDLVAKLGQLVKG